MFTQQPQPDAGVARPRARRAAQAARSGSTRCRRTCATLVLAEYRDPRLWAAGQREWRATLAEFEAFDGELPEIRVPLLVLTAGLTARNDAVQKELHDELAAAAPISEQHVIDGADHDQVLTHPKAARRVADRIAGFLQEVTHRAAAAS